MTDLTQAIAELRRVTPPNSPWEAGDIGGGSSPVDYHIATILNAAISSDLLPRADADLAVALMVEKVGKAIRSEAQISPYRNGMTAVYQRGLSDGFEVAAQVVDVLVSASAFAELQVLRDERDDAVASQFITRVERDGAEDHATETADELRQVRARAEAAEAELATLRAQVERLTGALTIAANRLHRCSVDYDTGTREFIEVGGWADEARAALTEGAAP